MKVVNAIGKKHQLEMGKVANRMPLQLGVVFAPQHTPLRAILDAGRRMLDQKILPSQGWIAGKPDKNAPDFLVADPHYSKFVNMPLSRQGRALNWIVPLVMGDGETLDAWYPYAAVEKAVAEHPGDKRDRCFQVPHPGKADWIYLERTRPGSSDLVTK
jgi:hypothetical protein